jgi:hypothetical protein
MKLLYSLGYALHKLGIWLMAIGYSSVDQDRRDTIPEFPTWKPPSVRPPPRSSQSN